MYITELELKNFRGASRLSLTEQEGLALDKHLNVFCGENGAGKSTILHAISLALARVISYIRSGKFAGPQIAQSDITNGEALSVIRISCQDIQGNISWHLNKRRPGRQAMMIKTMDNSIVQYATAIREAITTTQENTNIPIFAYYPVDRAVLDIPLRIRKRHDFTLLEAYEGSMTAAANFRLFFEWFRNREDLENERQAEVLGTYFKNNLSKGNKVPKDINLGEMRKAQERLAGTSDPQLDAVRKAISLFFESYFGKISVKRSPLRMEIEKRDYKLNVSQLSSGEKLGIALIGDLARRLAIANPCRKAPLEGEGIVLIDEVDLHLHPKWQRQTIPQLTKIFPGCQFILSTHSPQILTHVPPNSVFMLQEGSKGITAEKPRSSYGQTAEAIYEDILGLSTTRPDTIAKKLRSIYRSIDKNELTKAGKAISQLREELGDDAELIKMETLIKRKNALQK